MDFLAWLWLHCHNTQKYTHCAFIHTMPKLCVCLCDTARIIFLSIWMCAICALKCVNNNHWEGNHYFRVQFSSAIWLLSLYLFAYILSTSLCALNTVRVCIILAYFVTLKWSERISWIANSIVGLVVYVRVRVTIANGEHWTVNTIWNSELEFQIKVGLHNK